jgi:cytidylate kinase
MAIINISRQIGSLGDEIADRTADQLGYELFEKNGINAMVSDYVGDFAREMDIISAEKKPGFFDKLLYDRSIYNNLVRAIIYDIASRGNVVIRGRGGNFLLSIYPEVLNIRIVAPLSTRITRVQKNEPRRDIAEDIVNQSDQDRNGFVRYLFRQKPSDIDAYDIVINTRKIDVSSAVDILTTKAQFIDENHPFTEKFSNKLKRLSLGARIKATIQKAKPGLSHLTVTVESDNIVTLTGAVTCENEKLTIEGYARQISKGMTIENNIVIERPLQYRHDKAATY